MGSIAANGSALRLPLGHGLNELALFRPIMHTESDSAQADVPELDLVKRWPEG